MKPERLQSTGMENWRISWNGHAVNAEEKSSTNESVLILPIPMYNLRYYSPFQRGAYNHTKTSGLPMYRLKEKVLQNLALDS